MKVRVSSTVAALTMFCSSSQVGAATVTFYDTQSSFNAATTTTLLDDFSFPGVGFRQIGGHGTSSITRNGVTYADVSGTNDIVILSPGDYWNFGAAVGTTADYVVTTDYDEHIRASFSTDYRAVGFTAYFNGLGPGTLTVFGAGGGTIGTYAFPTSGDDPATGLADRGYLGFTSTAAITGFQWDTTGGGYLNTGFSNLSVDAVPEPSTWAMLLIGFAGIGFAAYRRRVPFYGVPQYAFWFSVIEDCEAPGMPPTRS
jgi:PEP-CTERM motif